MKYREDKALLDPVKKIILLLFHLTGEEGFRTLPLITTVMPSSTLHHLGIK
jgi:hypothetical protein